MDLSEDVLIALGVAFAAEMKKEKPKRKWSKNWFTKRSNFSSVKLLRELELNEPGDLKNYLRMDKECFQNLLNRIRPRIERRKTIMRDAVTAEERLTATLRYLATGNTYEDLKFSTAISPQLLGRIIPETCTAIYEELRDEYLKFPTNEDDWIKIANEFKEKWQFDTCCGAIDGKHINIVKPPNSGSYFYNYKGKFSIVLLAIVNANYEFIMVHTGINGRISDGGVLNETPFNRKLMEGTLNLPSPKIVRSRESHYSLSFAFVGDDAFLLHKNLLKPYPQRYGITREERIFNYRLSRARRISENAFGILASRFRVFHSDIGVAPQNVDCVVLATCVLHNYLRRNTSNMYIPTSYADQEDTESGEVIPGEWRADENILDSLQRLLEQVLP